MYGQKNFLQPQGIPPTKYRIQQIGCFLTSFANLLERFGKGINPADLNAIFRDRGIYIDVDDGVRDDLGWQSVTGYDGQIVVTSIGSGVPPHNNSIVKFVTNTNNFGTHFCLVNDINDGTIIDSWDGQVKSWDVYGGPVGYATYADITPQPIPAPPAPAPAPEPEKDYVEVQVQEGWGITFVLKAAGYTKEQWDNQDEWDRLSRLNGVTEGRIKLQPGAIVKVYKQPLPINVPAPAPEPTPAPVPVQEPTPLATPEPQPTTTTSSPSPVVPAEPVDWRLSYKVNDAGKYVSLGVEIIKDLEGKQPDLSIDKGRTVDVAGSFEKDGQKYYRTTKSATNGWWYGLPVEILKPVDQKHDTVGDEIFKALDLSLDAPMFKRLTPRQKMVALVAKLEGYLIRFVTTLTFKKKNKKETK